MDHHDATVLGRRRLSAHLVSISLEVDAGYATTGVPDEYVRLLIPNGSDEPTPRVYTISDHRIVDGRVHVDVDIALHDVGIGSDWARTVEPGDPVGITDPHGLYAAPADVPAQLLVADITGVPALARILRGLRPEQRAEVVVVLTDPADEIPLPSPARVTIDWRVVPDERHVAEALIDAVPAHDLTAGEVYVWLAGEASAARTVRKRLRRELGWPQAAFYTCGYWQLDAEAWNARYEQVAAEVQPAAVAAYERQQADGDMGTYLDTLEDIYDNVGL